MNRQYSPHPTTSDIESVSSHHSEPSVKKRTSLPRRDMLALVGAGLLPGSIAGCIGDTDDDADAVLPDIPRIEDPPSVVYVPTHHESMAHLPMNTQGDYSLTPMITYPHRFWTVTGEETTEVLPDDTRGVHLMVTPWDQETDQVLPMDSGTEIRIEQDGTLLETVSPWPMISQTMGFHFGDNVVLPEDGTYTVTVDLSPISIRKTRGFADRFNESASFSYQFTYEDSLRADLINAVEYLDEEYWGERGALQPMEHGHGVDIDAHVHGDDAHHHDGHNGHDHGMPFSSLPEADQYPGESLGEPASHDAQFVARYIENLPFAQDGYLLISPRTPYNRVPLPDMALSVEGAVNGDLVQTIDPALGLHYGIEATLDPGGIITVVIESPPQISRHNGYETAFLDMDSVEVQLTE